MSAIVFLTLLGNWSKAAELNKVRDLLDAEMAKCDLLCDNFHISRKPRKLGWWDVAA